MTETTPTSTILQRPADPPILALLKQRSDEIGLALPDGYTPERFTSVCINLVRACPKLLNCTPITFLATVMLSAQLGLEPGPPLGLSWIIPRRNKGQLEASFQIGAEGYRDLAYRSGQVKSIQAFVVYEGDDFGWMRGRGGVDWHHKPLGEPGREWTEVYAVAETSMGAEMFDAMTRAEVIEHRDKYVPYWKSSDSWKNEEDKMAKKTVLIRLCKSLPRSAEVRQAMVADGSTPRELRPELAGVLAFEADSAIDVEEGGDDDS